MSLNFPNLWSPTVLHQVQLEDRWSLASTFVIIYWVWCIPDVEGEDRKSINWIGLPGPEGGLLTPGLHGSGSALLHQASLFTAVWAIKLNFIKRSPHKKKGGKIYSIKLLYSTDSPFALQTNMQSHIVNVREGLLFAFDFIKSKHQLSYHSSSLYSPVEDRPSLFVCCHQTQIHIEPVRAEKKISTISHPCYIFTCLARQKWSQIFSSDAAHSLVCSYQRRADGTERNSGRNQGQWLLDNRSICGSLSFHYLPTSIADPFFFFFSFFDSISIVTSGSLFERGQSLLDDCLWMVQHQRQFSAVCKLRLCVCVCERQSVCLCVSRTSLQATRTIFVAER